MLGVTIFETRHTRQDFEESVLSLLTVAEAAERVGVSAMTLHRRIKDGTLPTYKEGAKTLVRLSDAQKLYPGTAPAPPPPGACRTIAIANQKGGVGKTSTAANLAAALARDGARVVAIDADPQGNLTQALGPDPDALERTLYNVLVQRVALADVALTPLPELSTLALVGANLDLSAAETELAGEVAREMRLKNALLPAVGACDFIVIDCPPSLSLLTLLALTAATEVLIPVNASVFSLRGVSKLLQTIEKVRQSVNPELSRVRALRNLVEGTRLAQDVSDELEQAFGQELLATKIRKAVAIGEAQAARLPITLHRPNEGAARDYTALAQEIRHGA